MMPHSHHRNRSRRGFGGFQGDVQIERRIAAAILLRGTAAAAAAAGRKIEGAVGMRTGVVLRRRHR